MKPLPAEDLDKTSTLFEPEPEHDLEPGIDVTGLGKSFKSFGSKEVIAVDSVTFKAFHGEITALLGHNGAGKTTTMSVLTGMISPSQGSAKINGYNITNEMHLVRQNLGLCPQHNMSFSDLTVLEHLLFFGSVSLFLICCTISQRSSWNLEPLLPVGLFKYPFNFS
jgi:ATP-binding cassette subfamily A (ABC1) protein 3